MQLSPPSPYIEIFGGTVFELCIRVTYPWVVVRRDGSNVLESYDIFKGNTLPMCCNPSWPGLDINNDIFTAHEDINGIVAHIIYH